MVSPFRFLLLAFTLCRFRQYVASTMREVHIVKPDLNFCSQNLLQSWGDAACEGFWSEKFPNGVTALLA